MTADDDQTVWMPATRNPRNHVVHGVRASGRSAAGPRVESDLNRRKRGELAVNPVARRTDARRRAAVIRTGIARSKIGESLNIRRNPIGINLSNHAENV